MTRSWENSQTSYRAAIVRVALGVFCMTGLPVFVPGMWRYFPVLAGYLGGALVFQWMIQRGVGGVARVIAGGLLDIAMLTFIVQRVGAQSTPLAGAYLLVGMLNALAVPKWAARTLALIGLFAYAGVVYAEAFGLLPYAPALPVAGPAPDVLSSTRSLVLLATLVASSTVVSERITSALRDGEADLRLANARLEELSQRDPLTQLYNRRMFVQRLEQELARVRRGHPMALLMIDLDHFKHINDQQGHLVGDELLRRMASAIQKCTRAVDVTGRFGGDEFMVILTDTEGPDANLVAERLVETLRHVGIQFDAEHPVTASIGVAVARAQDGVEVLLNTADDAAYRAKQAGGNSVYAKSPEHNSARFESGPRSVRAG